MQSVIKKNRSTRNYTPHHIPMFAWSLHRSRQDPGTRLICKPALVSLS